MDKEIGEDITTIEEAVEDTVAQESVEPAQPTEPVKSPREIELEKELDKWQKEAKAHQKTASKKAQEADNFKQFQESINQRIDILAEIVEQEVTKKEDYEEPKSKAPSYKERVQETESQRKVNTTTEQQKYENRVASEILKLITPLNMEFDKAEETKIAYLHWRAGDIDEALEEVKKVVTKVSESKKNEVDYNDPKVRTEWFKEESKKLLIENNELNTDVSQPTGAALGDEKWYEEVYGTGKSDDHVRASKINEKLKQRG